MDADDEAVLNLIAECEWDLSNPPGSLSSSQKEREADLHHTEGAPLVFSEGPADPAVTGFHLHNHAFCENTSAGLLSAEHLPHMHRPWVPFPAAKNLPLR